MKWMCFPNRKTPIGNAIDLYLRRPPNPRPPPPQRARGGSYRAAQTGAFRDSAGSWSCRMRPCTASSASRRQQLACWPCCWAFCFWSCSGLRSARPIAGRWPRPSLRRVVPRWKKKPICLLPSELLLQGPSFGNDDRMRPLRLLRRGVLRRQRPGLKRRSMRRELVCFLLL